jgi:hypothetical protein
MLNKSTIVAALAACSAAVLAAQTPSSGQQTSPGTETTTAVQPSTTLTGCVYREQDVPGRAPNVAERAGILEDYILAEVSQEPAAKAESTATPGATGTAGATRAAGSMYKLEMVSDEKLKAMVGKRVEVTGRVDTESGDAKGQPPARTSQTDQVIGRDQLNLSEFEVTSIREIAGTCPPKPTSR